MAPSTGVGIFEGKVFGLTGELPRKQVQATLKSNGASVSAIIHKRVSFVVSTADAVKYNTQKVRKAAKHGIPLVSEGFVEACALAKRVVDHAPYQLLSETAGEPALTPPAPTKSTARRKSGKKKSTAARVSAETAEKLQEGEGPGSEGGASEEPSADGKKNKNKNKKSSKRTKKRRLEAVAGDSTAAPTRDGQKKLESDDCGGGGSDRSGAVLGEARPELATKKKKKKSKREREEEMC